MGAIEQKNLDSLNLRVTLLGYPLLIGLFIIVILFLINLFGIAFTKHIFFKIITALFDLIFLFVSYLNYKRIKRRELSLFSYLTLNSLPNLAYDDESVLNYFSDERD